MDVDVTRGGLLEGEVLVQSGQKWSFMLLQPPDENEGKIKSTFIYKLVMNVHHTNTSCHGDIKLFSTL